MAVLVVGQQSGVDTPEAMRYALGALMWPSGALERRSGLAPTPGAADLTAVSPMVGRIAQHVAWVDGTTSSTQGGYPVIVTAPVDVTFDPGEAAVVRVDRIVLRVRDDPYDASGQQDGDVVIVKGQASGAANAVPASSILLWEVTVPAGASVGGGGFDISANRFDKRPWLSALGGTLTVSGATERDALTPHEGMRIWRSDAGDEQIYRGGGWRWHGAPRTVVKQTTEEVGSNTYQADDELTITGLISGATWDVEVIGKYSADADYDMKIGFTAPAGATMTWLVLGKGGTDQADGGFGQTDWTAQDMNGEPRLGGKSAANNTDGMTFYAKGTFTSGAGGALTVRWAQANAGGGSAPTKLHAGSRITVTRIA